MPIMTTGGGYVAAPRTAAPTMQTVQGAERDIGTQDRGFLTTTLGDAGLGVVDLADTVSSSLGFTNREDINGALLRAIDSPGLNDFYHDNRGGIEAFSGIYGMIGTELITRRLIAPTGLFMKTLSQLPYARRVAQLDMQYANAMQTVRNVDTALAARGTLGIESFIGRATVDRAVINTETGAMELLPSLVSRDAARKSALRYSFGMGARHAAIGEGIMAVTLNQNSMIYGDSTSHNLAFSALGIGIGGGLNHLFTNWTMRKFANSDQLRRTFADALDPEGIEQGRLGWKSRQVDPELQVGQYFGGTSTDRATSLLTEASHLRQMPSVAGASPTAAEDARALFANRESLATQTIQQAQEELNKVTTKGISTNGYTRFSMEAPYFGNHMSMAAYRDPGVFYGAEQVGAITDELSVFGVHSTRDGRIEERLREAQNKLVDPKLSSEELEANQSLVKRLQYEKTLTPLALIDGELMPISEAAAIEGFAEPQVRFNPTPPTKGQPKLVDNHGLWEVVSENAGQRLSLDSEFAYHFPGNKSIDKADHFDVLRLYRLGQQAIGQMAKFEGPLRLPAKPSWFQLDMAEEILKQNPAARVLFPGTMTRESAQVESLLQKAQALKQHDVKVTKETSAAAKKGKTVEAQLSQLRVRYNLPRLTAYERGVLGTDEHPIMGLLRGMQHFDAAEVRAMSLDQIKDGVAKYKRIGDIAPVSAKDVESLSGNSFAYMLDDAGKPIKPILMYKRPFEVAEWTKEYVVERMAANKMQTIHALTDEAAAPLTKAITTANINSADFDVVSRANELLDTQIQGSLTGSKPQTFWGSLSRSIKPSEWRDRDNPILLAATRVRETVSRQVGDAMKVTIQNAFGDLLGQVENARNASSKLLLNQFHSARAGWDLAKKPIEREGGFAAFLLSDTAANRARFQQFYQREMPKGQTLLSPNGTEVVLDALGAKVQSAFNSVTDSLLAEKNTLLRSMGHGEVGRLEHFVPPPKTDGKFMGFVIGPDGRTVPGMTVVENTQVGFNKARQAMEGKLNELGMGYQFRTQEEVRQFASIWDRAQMDFIDPGTTAIQPNKQARGALTGYQTRTDAFANSLKFLQDQYKAHGDDLIETLFKEQINAAKSRKAIAANTTRNKAGQYKEEKWRSIYDFYLENLQGRSKLNSEGSVFGPLYNTIEGHIDKFLAEATPPVSKVWQATNAWIGKRVPWDSSAQANRDFNVLTDKLGPHMPFKSAAELVERASATAMPPTLAKMTGAMNRFSAAMTLRVMEVAHPIMNLSGIINAVPAVIRQMTPRKFESAEDFAARIGHVATTFNLKDGRQLGVLDMGKVSSRAFQRAWSATSHADYDYMVRNGFLTQEVAEFQRQFGAIRNKNSWQKFMSGDPHATSGFAKKGLVGWTSILSDKSEDFSRAWAHMTGLEVADVVGIKGLEARNAFAHDVANKMIANYSPLNRPEVFQGAVGAPIGLFQTFIMNYYQRLFRYVETGEYANLGIQMATQGALFGMTGLPGWKMFNDLMTKENGSGDPSSAIRRRFGPETGDWLAAGALSNLPKLFGGEGVDLYSRGDTNIRQLDLDLSRSPGAILTSLVPSAQVISKLASGVFEAASLFSSQNPHYTNTQLAEVFSNSVANRPIAGMIEQFFSHGNDTDPSGQLVSQTLNGFESAARLIGLRSLRQSEEINAFYASRRAMELQSGQKEMLNQATRSAIREGRFDDLAPIYTRYMENGGDPRYFRRWIKEQYEVATTTRSQRALNEAHNNPARMDEVLRFMDAGLSVDEDETMPDDEQYILGQANDQLNQPTAELGTYNGQMTIPLVGQTQRTPGF